jgi:flagellar motor switch protein FliG
MQLQGAERAAIFLLSLPEERSVQILRHFQEDELQQLRTAIEGLGPIQADTVNAIYADFASAFKQGLTSMRGSDVYLHKLVSQAHGEERAVQLFAEPEALPAPQREPISIDDDQPLAKLEDVDPDLLTVTLLEEHPQVSCVVLAHVETPLAAAVLERMPSALQADLVKRISKLRTTTTEAFEDAQRVLGGLELKAGGEVDGMDSAANILNSMPPVSAENVLEALTESNPEEVEQLRRAMFTFENLVDADTRGLQALLRDVPSDTLLAALKTASDPLKDKIFGCMSSRAADMLREELDVMAPMRLSEVEQAQHQVVEIAMRLINEGKISVEGRGEGLV